MSAPARLAGTGFVVVHRGGGAPPLFKTGWVVYGIVGRREALIAYGLCVQGDFPEGRKRVRRWPDEPHTIADPGGELRALQKGVWQLSLYNPPQEVAEVLDQAWRRLPPDPSQTRPEPCRPVWSNPSAAPAPVRRRPVLVLLQGGAAEARQPGPARSQ